MAEMTISQALKNKHISYEDLSRLVGKYMIDQAKINKGVAKAAAAVEAKLADIEAGAQVNVIESIAVKDENIVTKTGKAIEIDLDAYAKKSDVAAGVNVKGSVNTYTDLPTEGMTVGDMYNVKAKDTEHGVNAGDNVVWTGTEWDNFGHFVDMDGYVEKDKDKDLLAKTEIARLEAMADEANKVTAEAKFAAGILLAALTIQNKTGEAQVINIYSPEDEFATTDEIDALYVELAAAAQAEADKAEAGDAEE